jgi:hypothetical protein
MIEMTQTCLVCLEDSAINIKTIPLLLKICECDYWIHEHCINAWLIKEPVCPICKRLLIYENEALVANNNNINNNNNNNNNNINNNNINNNNNIKFMRDSLVFSISILIIVIIVIIIFV